MRFAFLGAAASVIALVVACGGSSSESPWPVEPEHRDLDPINESNAGSPTEERTPESRGELSPEAPKRAARDEAPDAGRPAQSR